MAIDYTRNEVDVLIDLIRTGNARKPLSTAQVTFGSPQVFTALPSVNRNTVVMATAIPGRGYKDNAAFYYNRVPLPAFVPPDQADILTFEAGEFTTLSELLPELNERLSINLTPAMIYEASLSSFPIRDGEDFQEVVLKVRPNSLVYLEQLTIKLARSLIDLTVAIPDPTLDGLIYASPE